MYESSYNLATMGGPYASTFSKYSCSIRSRLEAASDIIYATSVRQSIKDFADVRRGNVARCKRGPVPLCYLVLGDFVADFLLLCSGKGQLTQTFKGSRSFFLKGKGSPINL